MSISAGDTSISYLSSLNLELVFKLVELLSALMFDNRLALLSFLGDFYCISAELFYFDELVGSM